MAALVFDTQTVDRSNGRSRSGRGSLIVVSAVGAVSTTEPIRMVAHSVPTQSMSGGQPA